MATRDFLDASDVQIQLCETLLQSLANENGSEGKGTVKLDFKITSFEDFITANGESGAKIPKYDVVYLVEMLYYVKDPFTVLGKAVDYLEDSGKLFLIHTSKSSGYAKVNFHQTLASWKIEDFFGTENTFVDVLILAW